MEFVLLKIGSPEWEEIWTWLESHPINKDMDDPSIALNEGFAWEYIGTYKMGNIGISEFRHKKHGLTNRLEILNYKHELREENIEKKFRI